MTRAPRCRQEAAVTAPKDPARQRMFAAAQALDVEAIASALAEGLSPEERFGGHHMTPLLLVAVRGQGTRQHRERAVRAATLLLDAGADPDAATRSGATALFNAVRAKNPALVDVLLARGARCTQITGRNNNSLLNLAARHAPPEIVERLAEAGADPNAGVTKFGNVALLTAITHGRARVARVLLRAGADPSGRGADAQSPRESPLAATLQRSMVTLARELLAAGADPNARDTAGRTALMVWASSNPWLEKERARVDTLLPDLLAAGADLDAVDDRGYTALMSCARPSVGLPQARMLVEAGARLELRDHEGNRAEDIARQYRATELASYLHAKRLDAGLSGPLPGGRVQRGRAEVAQGPSL